MQHWNRATNRTIEIDGGRPACHDPVRSARSLMRRTEVGVLTTLSRAEQGYPFGSVVPYVLTVDRRPALHLSAMARATLDIRSDTRVSLTVNDPMGRRGQECAWVTMIGDAVSIPAARFREIEQRYFDHLPLRQSRETAHRFYWIDPLRIRYGGYRGESFWIEPEEWFAVAVA